jgi:transposase
MNEQPIQLDNLNDSQKDALIRELLARISVLEARIKELEGQQKKDSGNSGKPPSSDGLSKKPQANGSSLRRKSRKKPGGQVGHPGYTLQQSETPDRVEEHPPCTCGHCGRDLAGEPAGGYDTRQVYDLPPLRIEVTEHRAPYKLCPGCQTLNRGEFPEHLTHPVQYGPGIKSAAVYFKNYQLLPYD